MRKSKSIITLFVLIVLAVLNLCACGQSCGKEKDPDYPSNIIEETQLSLSTTELTMVVGEEFVLKANYNPIGGNKKTYFSSSEAIASVDEYGRITANSVGEASITVKYGNDEATCKVTVGYGDILPVLKFEERFGDNLQVGKGDKFNLKAYVEFNGKRCDDAAIKYELTDTSIGVIENSIFTASAFGATDVTVSATWRDVSNVSTMKRTFKITVLSGVEIIVNDGKTDFTLYNIAEIGGNSYKTNLEFVVSATDNGTQISAENILIEVISGSDVVRYNNGKVQALKPGTATICVTVKDKTGVETQELTDVIVKPSVGTYEKELLFSAYDGELPVEEIFGEKVDLVSAETLDKQSLEINSNKTGVLGLKATSKDGPTAQTITVYSADRGWELSLKIYSAVIEEASDLEMFHHGGKSYSGPFSETDRFDGYYILANDIDMTGSIFNTSASMTEVNSVNPKHSLQNIGLVGTFDGNGHRIYNLNRYNGSVGIFAAINGGTVKNVSISSSDDYIVQGATAYCSALIRNATFENVHIKTAKRNGTETVLLARAVVNSKFKNCIFEGESRDITHGLFLFLEDWNGSGTPVTTTFENCYYISPSSITQRKAERVLHEAANIKNSLTTEELGSALWKDTIWIEGIKRYSTSEDMVNDAENNDYTSFNANYWDMTSGRPVWKNK